MIYVTLPPDFVAIKYPGYFWHLKEQKLYSLKIGGDLKPLTKRKYFVNWKYRYKSDRAGEQCYRISHKGRRRTLFENDLKEIGPAVSQIKVKQW